jgi:hypothetical protein
MIRTALFVLLAGASCISAQVFNYPSGPNSCNYTSGYTDPAFCTIPNELPLGNFSPPQPGGTYVDQNFGGTVKLLTGPGYNHTYALPSPFSANNKYMAILEQSTGNGSIINAATGAVVYPNVPYSWSGRFWDPYDDESYYLVSGTKILKYTLNTKTTSTIVDYATNGYNFTNIITGGSSDTTKDNWLAFWAPNEHRVCTIDLGSVRTYCADYTASNPNSRVGWDNLDFVLVSKGVDSVSNKRYVLLMGSPAMGAWSVNMQTGNLDYEFRGPENPDVPGNGDGVCDPNENCLSSPHSDTMAGADGRQYLVQAKGSGSPCELDLVALSLNAGGNLWKPVSAGGGKNVAMKLANCGDIWPDHHIGCAKSVPYCVISTMTGYYQNPGDVTSEIRSAPHRDEIILVHGIGTDITRLAKSRSVQYKDDSYWTQVRAALSNDGSTIAFDSNFGNPKPGTVCVATVGTGVSPGVSASIAPPAPAPISAPSAPAPVVVSAGVSLPSAPVPAPVTVPSAPAPAPVPVIMSMAVAPLKVLLSGSQTHAFSAAVSGSSNTGVTWSVSPNVGTVSAAGVYTAPDIINTAQTVTVTAVSLADASKSASAIVRLAAPVAAVGKTAPF